MLMILWSLLIPLVLHDEYDYDYEYDEPDFSNTDNIIMNRGMDGYSSNVSTCSTSD